MFVSRISADGREQYTIDHLLETAEYAKILGAKFSLSAFAYLSAVFHDMGKLSNDFVQYLRASASGHQNGTRPPTRGSVIHSLQGAKYIYEISENEKELILVMVCEIVALCIAGHHGYLRDVISPLGETPLRTTLTNDKVALHFGEIKAAFEKENILKENLTDLVKACHEELLSFIRVCKDKNLNIAFMSHLLAKVVFSCLIDADRYNAYCFESGLKPENRILTPPWEKYCKRLEDHLSSFSNDTRIDKLRSVISQLCLQSSKRSEGIYRLAVPTGGGKTLASLRFALNHAVEHQLDRIIYVIPYLSVLEQTAAAIRTALSSGGINESGDDDFILEHHSNFIPPEEEDEMQAYRLLTDRWNQPVIITTMVQFLESLYSHRASDLRKLHNLSRAVIIFDEVQTLPVKCVHLFNDALNFIHTFGQSTVLLCTATQPLLDRVKSPINFSNSPDLVSDINEDFKELNRTRPINKTIPGGYTNEKLCDFVFEKFKSANNCLVILNTKKQVADLYSTVKEYLNEHRQAGIIPYHLSTSMCPAHRFDVIGSMLEEGNPKKLKGEPILCISTQLIEAGVDISFNCVVRALAGLDSIAQAAGRCNRHGEDPSGREVYIINMAEENLSRLPDIESGRQVTRRILNEQLASDLLSQNIMDRYYEEYFFRRMNEMDYNSRSGPLYDLLSCNNKGYGALMNLGYLGKPPALRQAYKSSGEEFYIIERNTKSVLVPYKKGETIALEYDQSFIKNKAKLLREIARYSVALYPYQIDALEEARALSYVGGDVLFLKKEFYDSQLGVVFRGDQQFLYI